MRKQPRPASSRLTRLGIALTVLSLCSTSAVPAQAPTGRDGGADASAVEPYVGVYARHLGSPSQLSIVAGEEGLALESRGQRVALTALGDDRFRGQGAPIELEFLGATESGFETLVVHQGPRRNELHRVSLLQVRYREQAGELRPHAVSDAVLARDVDSLRSLLARSADPMELDLRPNVGGRNGRRPLNWAALLDQPAAIELLLEHGAAIDLTNKSGFTPLHHAAEVGSVEAATLLLTRGAEPAAKTARGLSPLDIALRGNHGSVVELLRSALEQACSGSGDDAAPPAGCDDEAGPESYRAPAKLEDQLPVAALDAQLPAVQPLLQLLEGIEKGSYGTVDSLLVAHRGKLVVERYYNGWTAERPHPLQSISKSITALLVGSAIQQGHLESVAVPIRSLLPEHAGELTGSERDLTVEDLLTMAAGYDWNEESPSYFEADNLRRQEVLSEDPVAFTLSREHVASPGEVFTYSGGYVTVVGQILANATDSASAAEYLPKSTLAQLGLGRSIWMPQAGGVTNTAGGLMLVPRDLVKIGLLMLDGGSWRGEQLLGEEFVQRSLGRQIATGSRWGDYGYFWWGGPVTTAAKSYEADAGLGFGGQYLILVPELDLVVAVNSTEYQGEVPIDSMLSLSILPVFEASRSDP